jgi:hypothetical protein
MSADVVKPIPWTKAGKYTWRAAPLWAKVAAGLSVGLLFGLGLGVGIVIGRSTASPIEVVRYEPAKPSNSVPSETSKADTRSTTPHDRENKRSVRFLGKDWIATGDRAYGLAGTGVVFAGANEGERLLGFAPSEGGIEREFISEIIVGNEWTLHGPCETLRRNGALERFCFEHGKKHGVLAMFHQNGRLRLMCEYKHGVMDGPTLMYHENGTLEVFGVYSGGALVTAKGWNSDGTPTK